MTTEANDNDARVSETYRAMATETTPQDLDSQILSMAAAETDSRRAGFGLSRLWFRPIAWAATIGLSLAFVLEMSEFNKVAEPAIQTDADAVLEERVLDDVVDAAPADIGRLQSQQEFDKRTDAPAAAKPTAARAAEKVAPAAGAASVSEDFAADEILMLQEAEEQTRARSGSERAFVADSPVAALAIKKERADLCEAGARLSAASWYACVEDLREKELHDTASAELEALLSEFPDFEIPEGNR
jgi:hypothetical protein